MSGATNQAIEQEDETRPLWKYVSKTIKILGGGNYEIKCNIFEIPFNGSYTKVKAHLLKISGAGVWVYAKITLSKLAELKKVGQWSIIENT